MTIMRKVEGLAYHSRWGNAVKEPIGLPKLHVLALALYAGAMLAYTAYCIVVFFNFVQPLVFERQESGRHGAAPLDVEIDCQDCRAHRVVWHDSEVWKLSWDYSSLPGGCAGTSPAGAYSEQLRAFCAAQGAAAAAAPPYQRMACTNFNPLVISIPGNLLRAAPGPVPWSVEAAPADCQAKCDADDRCQSFVWSKPAYRPEGPERIPYNGTNLTNPLKQNNTCVLLAYPFYYTCLVDSPAPWGEHLDVYVRQPPPPPLDELADPLDRCTITSRDAAMFAQSPSPDPTQTDTTTLAKTGWGAHTSAPQVCACSADSCVNLRAGPNPNYVGPPGNHHGMSTGGSNYKLKYAVPMCYVSDDNTDKKGLRLEMINIPHHAFSDPLKIGKVGLVYDLCLAIHL